MRKLTLGMAVYDDYPGVEFTVQALRLYHDMTDVEIVVVDNNPESKEGLRTKVFCEKTGCRYVPYTERQGTSGPRDHIFKIADGRFVAVMDPHVMLVPGAVSKLKQTPVNQRVLYSGPMLNYELDIYATHFADVWRGGMWGIWAQAWGCPCGKFTFDTAPHGDGRGDPLVGYHKLQMGWDVVSVCPGCGRPLPIDIKWSGHERALKLLGYLQMGLQKNPFEIPGMGLGFFACPRDHWLGFHPLQTNFGGEEMYIHEKFRQAGGRVLCDPELKWWHRFGRACHSEAPPYPLPVWSTVRNYVLEFKELNRPTKEIRDHFVNIMKKVTDAQFNWLLEDPENRTKPQGMPTLNSKGPQTAGALYQWTLDNPRDLQEHFPKLYELASRCSHVTAFSKRKEMIAPLMAARPTLLVNHCTEEAPAWFQLCRALVANWADKVKVETLVSGVADSLMFSEIDKTDMLVLAQVHNKARVLEELNRFGKSVNKWIVVQGTANFGEIGEDGSEGLLVGIREWCKANPEWHRVYQADNQYGLTVLSKDPKERSIDHGPGFELHCIFEENLKIQMSSTCACRRMMNQMNSWGVAGCREHFDEIVKHLKDHKDDFGWGDKLKAAMGMIWSGLWLKVNWNDPFSDLVTIAIDRAEVSDREWESLNGTT